MSYRSFRTAVAEFLAKRTLRLRGFRCTEFYLSGVSLAQTRSRDFHSALSPEEFNAILYRIKAHLL